MLALADQFFNFLPESVVLKHQAGVQCIADIRNELCRNCPRLRREFTP